MRTLVVACLVAGMFPVAAAASPRKVISLDGRWQIAEGRMNTVPTKFDHEVPVPGLVDMAEPPFVEPGPKVLDREKVPQKDPRRDAFWYRRTFTIEAPIPPVATLKIGKAMFGTRVILNGRLLGDHAPCFTAGLFDARDALRSGENEVLIQVGADRDALGDGALFSFDCEKVRYIPGIFDSVELILSGTPRIDNVQVAPNIADHRARVRLWLKSTTDAEVTIEVREAKSGRVAGSASAPMGTRPEEVLDLVVPIANCRLWSPEDPFLYELTVRTPGDEFTTRFGMREFKFDGATGRAILNGKPYFMRGSNITLYRFFEDPERGNLPWNSAWVRTLHQQVKDMHWNCLRYCIGFPPESWYTIADEEGILIQDEFPVWREEAWPKELRSDELARQYGQWMRERWNHPCVVIWDACNETKTPETGAAIRQVRGLDLSGRPWDNGYTLPANASDMSEQHPYHFHNDQFKLRQLADADPAPWERYQRWRRVTGHAVVINEYGWLWLNRDGTPTTLTKQLYKNLLGNDSTVQQRRLLYARYTAAETEFWRCHRTAAAVMHFTTLGYSRPGGQTSDNWRDVQKLEWDPDFYRYVRDSFAPVGLMIDAWAESYPAGKAHEFPVVIVNDLEKPWSGEVRLRILREGKPVMETQTDADVAAMSTARQTINLTVPAQPGKYQVEATLLATPAGPVSSFRDFSVPAGQ